MIPPLQLDYAPARRGPQGSRLMLVGALLVLAALIARHADLTAATAELEATLAATPVAEPDSGARMPADLGVGLAALEAAAAPEVALLALSAAGDSLQFEAEAEQLPAAVDFVQRLGRSGAFAGIVIERIEVQRNLPGQPVRVSCRATLGGRAS